MRNRFDRLGKALALEALRDVGVTDAQYELDAETTYADLRHEPAPGGAALRHRLGLLGELVQTPCLIELYSQAPGADDLRGCLAKHLAYAQERARVARSGGGPPVPTWTWIVSAGVPRTLLSEVTFEQPPGGRSGVYLLGGDLRQLGVRIGLVIASELPAERSTLLVRIMAGGRQLTSAVREVAALPRTAFERVVAEPVLVDFQHRLEQQREDLDPDEEEFIMVMHRSWEDARAEGRAEGRVEGRVEGRLETLRRLLALKFGGVSREHERLLEEASPEDLDRYLERILFADSVDAIFA